MLDNVSTTKELLKSLKEDGDFRDNFKKSLWEVFVDSKELTCTRYEVYFNTRKQILSVYELTNNTYLIDDDNELISILTIDAGEWEPLYSEYNDTKEWLEEDGDEMYYTFDEWIEEEVKDDYIKNTIDLIIENLEWKIKYEQ